eukprot:4920382-Amphidinium_carterae.1
MVAFLSAVLILQSYRDRRSVSLIANPLRAVSVVLLWKDAWQVAVTIREYAVEARQPHSVPSTSATASSPQVCLEQPSHQKRQTRLSKNLECVH